MSDQGTMASVVSARSRTIPAVHSPLGFCVLALLIVEFFLWGGTRFNLSEPWRIAAIGVGVLLFLLVFGVVVWLVIRYPENLVFREESQLQYTAMKRFGTPTHPSERPS